MKKVAIFVEGATEQELTRWIIENSLPNGDYQLILKRQFGGTLVDSEIVHKGTPQAEILIANCQSDGAVKSQILERHSLLKQQGYTQIIGLRDLYPLTPEQLTRLETGLQVGLPKTAPTVEIFVAVRETESWFLDEVSHFERVDPRLTNEKRLAHGFDLAVTHGKDWEHPAQALHDLYSLAGKGYRKSKTQRARTIEALDYAEFSTSACARSHSLRKYLDQLTKSLLS